MVYNEYWAKNKYLRKLEEKEHMRQDSQDNMKIHQAEKLRHHLWRKIKFLLAKRNA